MSPGGVETSVFHNTIVPESAQVDFSCESVYGGYDELGGASAIV